jgi:hypothetical protein
MQSPHYLLELDINLTVVIKISAIFLWETLAEIRDMPVDVDTT